MNRKMKEYALLLRAIKRNIKLQKRKNHMTNTQAIIT